MSLAASLVQVAALVLWSFQLAPQVWANYKARSTVGLSAGMLFMWCMASLWLGVVIVASEFGVLFVLQPQLFLLLSLICWAQTIYYADDSPRSKRRGIAYGILAAILFAGVEIGLSLLLLHYSRNRSESTLSTWWPFVLLNGLAIFFLIAGFAPQYREIWLTGHARGVSRWFLVVDMSGALCSVVALALKDGPFESLVAASYIAVFVLDGGIMIVSLSGWQRDMHCAVEDVTKHAPSIDHHHSPQAKDVPAAAAAMTASPETPLLMHSPV